ncbi:aminoacyl-tRNA hydrolase [Lentilactobacillus buchneri]|uniref:aminoacyl-tRNA hydrolase n=1 Tax=Lentilactobacillus buchneri TaxID=1581 RepID=UPI0012919A8C|nr:aminoacyl-tRNA hydrolase [Lentilactobacillus buchneri]MDS1015129.1 aminoacyl-tRNA hydrolase [Lentilactobacillus buchneri]MQM60871.1 aminoacyl-tRNA hydrolase [Lentilactobacillus buchneri]MQM77982.1 aminoacyl-tRNA hydrolase [Lentilactobacillus buchneri]MQM80589.1 aminoacyl-tRNA hydrolase [Lentilactobacillus buchneri]MQM88037.1 aminoacyl-tRNA hydrolase [Lentilactobacillus buchneri]
MKMIVGLGNIGPQYDGTRHNTGFMVVEQFAKSHDILIKTRKMNAKYGSGFVNNTKVMVVEPTTFMNDSGLAVRPLMDYFDVSIEDLIIVHDDMDLPVGKIRIKDKGSAGGHNGIKSIIASVGTQNFDRIRVGIDHPDHGNTVVNYVLGRFSKDQAPMFKQAADHAVYALDDWIDGMSIPDLENQYN